MLSYPFYRRDSGDKFKDLVSGRICLCWNNLPFHAMRVLNTPIDLPNDSLFLFIGIIFLYNTLWLSFFPFPNCFPNLSPPPQSNFMFFSLFQRKKKVPKSKQTNPKDKNKTSPKPKQKLTPKQQQQQLQTKPNQSKKHGIHFVLANYFWAWGLLWSVVDTLSAILLKKTDFNLS